MCISLVALYFYWLSFLYKLSFAVIIIMIFFRLMTCCRCSFITYSLPTLNVSHYIYKEVYFAYSFSILHHMLLRQIAWGVCQFGQPNV